MTAGVQLTREGLLANAISETISGVLSQHRASARARGLTVGAFTVAVPFGQLAESIELRFAGMRRDPDLALLAQPVPAEELCVLLRTNGMNVADDGTVELVVRLPPARESHAR